ncbi:MAG: uncharacterized protein JWQ94_3398, partial [Tardiphaga sp.]|nr:uncharacterized protein [Tardiphaga sp.]
IDAARASAAEFSPALVLLGIDFLQQDGAAVLADLAVRLPETKLLLVAGSVHDRLATAALAWGGHDVLGKPITYEAVLGKVDALLGRQAARSARSAFHQPLTSSQRGGHADQL